MAGRFSVEAIFKAVDKMTAPIARMQSRMKTFTDAAERGIKGLDKAADRWLGGMKKVGLGSAAMGAAAAAGLAVAARPGMEFEQQMANLGAAYLKTRDQIGDLEKKALELGASTQFSATEVAAAMEAMAKAGFEEHQALIGIEGMTYAAAAAGEDLATTAGNVSAVMKGMGIDVSKSTEVADLLAYASVKTASSISSLAESMSKVSSTSRQLKVPLKDSVAMVALLQDAGLDASEAGSATATMLTMMAKPSKQVAATMKKLGVSFKDEAGNMKEPVAVLAELVKAGEKAGGNMEQVAFFADLVGLRGQRAAVNLKDLFKAGDYTKLVEGLDKKAAGTSKKMSDLRMNTMTGDLDVFIENVKSLQIELFAMASGPLRAVVQGMTAWIDKNKDLVVSGIVDTVRGIAENMPAIVQWGERIVKIVAVITAAAAAVKLWAGAMALLNAVMALNPISLIAIAVVGAVALIWAFWPEVSKFFTDLWEGIVDISKSIGAAIYGWVLAVFNPIKDFLVGWFEFVVGIWTLVIGASMTILQPFFDWFVGKFGWIGDIVVAFWTALWDGLVAIVKVSWDIIVSAITAYVDAVKAVWSTLTDFFSGLWDGIKSVFWSVMGPVFEKIEWAINKIRGIGRGTLGTDDETAAGGASFSPQVVSPQERTARTITETTNNSEGELLIRDTTGKAVMTKAPTGPIRMSLQRSGAF